MERKDKQLEYSMTTPLLGASIDNHNIGEELLGALGYPGRASITVSTALRMLMDKHSEINSSVIGQDKLNAQTKSGLINLYNYICKCPDKNVMELESYTIALLKLGVLSEEKKVPYHSGDILEMRTLANKVRHRKDSHQARYAHDTFTRKSYGGRFFDSVYEEVPSSDKKGKAIQDILCLSDLIYKANGVRNPQTYTKAEIGGLTEIIRTALQTSIEKGYMSESCKLLAILSNSNLTPEIEKSAPNMLSSIVPEYMSKIIASYGKHTRLAVKKMDVSDQESDVAHGRDLTSGQIASYSKTDDVEKFINDIMAGKYGAQFADEQLCVKLKQQYNNYLVGSRPDREARSQMVQNYNTKVRDYLDTQMLK